VRDKISYFYRYLYIRNLLVITWDYEAVMGEYIRFQPLWKWLLEQTDYRDSGMEVDVRDLSSL